MAHLEDSALCCIPSLCSNLGLDLITASGLVFQVLRPLIINPALPHSQRRSVLPSSPQLHGGVSPNTAATFLMSMSITHLVSLTLRPPTPAPSPLRHLVINKVESSGPHHKYQKVEVVPGMSLGIMLMGPGWTSDWPGSIFISRLPSSHPPPMGLVCSDHPEDKPTHLTRGWAVGWLQTLKKGFSSGLEGILSRGPRNGPEEEVPTAEVSN